VLPSLQLQQGPHARFGLFGEHRQECRLDAHVRHDVFQVSGEPVIIQGHRETLADLPQSIGAIHHVQRAPPLPSRRGRGQDGQTLHTGFLKGNLVAARIAGAPAAAPELNQCPSDLVE
jgi:hypothetical protein